LSDFNETSVLGGQIFAKYSNVEFRENPSSGSRCIPRGQADVTELVAPFRNFANAPKLTQTICEVSLSADYKKHSSSREADSCATAHEIPRILRDTKIHRRVHNS